MANATVETISRFFPSHAANCSDKAWSWNLPVRAQILERTYPTLLLPVLLHKLGLASKPPVPLVLHEKYLLALLLSNKL